MDLRGPRGSSESAPTRQGRAQRRKVVLGAEYLSPDKANLLNYNRAQVKLSFGCVLGLGFRGLGFGV